MKRQNVLQHSVLMLDHSPLPSAGKPQWQKQPNAINAWKLKLDHWNTKNVHIHHMPKAKINRQAIPKHPFPSRYILTDPNPQAALHSPCAKAANLKHMERPVLLQTHPGAARSSTAHILDNL